MPRSYALGNHFEAFIAEQVKTGRYNNASEVVRAGLRLLEDRESLSAPELEAWIKAGVDSGPTMPSDKVLDRLEAKYTAQTERR